MPKIPIRKSMICSKCDYYDVADLDTVLRKLKEDRYRIAETPKVEALFRKKSLVRLNEVQIRSIEPKRALRFSVGKTNFIADGLVASNPYGSTAYYSSLGYEPFGSGIRIGLNNLTGQRKYFVVKKEVRIIVQREHAFLAADNQEKMHRLGPSDAFVVRAARQKARFVKFL